jgi:hypothetical protein
VKGAAGSHQGGALFCRWQEPAKTYLEQAPQSISLRELAEAYGRHVRQFCEWYRDKVLDIWGAEQFWSPDIIRSPVVCPRH